MNYNKYVTVFQIEKYAFPQVTNHHQLKRRKIIGFSE